MSAALSRTVLAISAFRSDESVLALLERAFAPDSARFGAVIVVDSLGSGKIAEEIAARGWSVQYENAATNLGSAGNLARRLRMAADSGLDWCLALNHDAMLDTVRAEKLVACGMTKERTAVVYPQLHFTRAGRYDRPRTGFTLFGRTDPHPASGDAVPVKWGSSNGALYFLDAIRQTADLWPDLWMGYEDLALGHEFDRAGWRQWLCAGVQVDDDYEYRTRGTGSARLLTSEKPAWYSYYQARNPILIGRRTGWTAVGRGACAARLLVDLALIVGTRDRKRERVRLWASGVRHGWARLGGKGPVP